MKVILVNGSPHEKGCTYTALNEMAKVFVEEGIDAEIYHIGTEGVTGCMACNACSQLGKCVIDDKVNEFLALANTADGFVFGSPVYYASMAGSMVSFMDRVFYANKKKTFRLKPAAAIASARRAGNVAAFDEMNKYFAISEMPIISSNYWNTVFGSKAEDVLKDVEGLQTIRILAQNMAWFLKCKEAAEKAGVKMPEPQKKTGMNFIR